MKNKIGMSLVTMVGFAVVLGCGKLTELANKTANTRTDDAPKEFTLAGKEWKSYNLEQTDIKVELPGAPSDKTPSESLMPAGYKQIFSSMRIWSYDEKGFQSSYTQLVPSGKKKWTIKELADTS